LNEANYSKHLQRSQVTTLMQLEVILHRCRRQPVKTTRNKKWEPCTSWTPWLFRRTGPSSYSSSWKHSQNSYLKRRPSWWEVYQIRKASMWRQLALVRHVICNPSAGNPYMCFTLSQNLSSVNCTRRWWRSSHGWTLWKKMAVSSRSNKSCEGAALHNSPYQKITSLTLSFPSWLMTCSSSDLWKYWAAFRHLKAHQSRTLSTWNFLPESSSRTLTTNWWDFPSSSQLSKERLRWSSTCSSWSLDAPRLSLTGITHLTSVVQFTELLPWRKSLTRSNLQARSWSQTLLSSQEIKLSSLTCWREIILTRSASTGP